MCPPFNLAGELPADVNFGKADDPVATHGAQPQSRQASGNLKDRFKRIFGRDRRGLDQIPPQQVASTQPHFDLCHGDVSSSAEPTSPNRLAPPIPPQAHSPAEPSLYRGAKSYTSRSRVTSWANSTDAGTIKGSIAQSRLSAIDELPSRIQLEALRTQSRTSMIGRAIRMSLPRRHSKANWKGSEDSQGLFEALQVQLADKQSPDSSPFPASSRPQTCSTAYPTPAKPGSRSPELRASFASFDPEILAQRQKRSDHRWHDILAEQGSGFDDNPYRLGDVPSPSRDAHLPMVVRCTLPSPASFIQDQVQSTRTAVVSPSIYSRATDDSPRRADSPDPRTDTMITITGREVKRYPLNSPARSRPPPVRPSQEWKEWITNHVGTLDVSTVGSLDLPQGEPSVRDLMSPVLPPEGLPCPKASIVQARTNTPSSASASPVPCESVQSSELRLPKQRRKDMENRPVSRHMNERYPMVETGKRTDKGIRALHRSVSQKSLKAIRRIASGGKVGPTRETNSSPLLQPVHDPPHTQFHRQVGIAAHSVPEGGSPPLDHVTAETDKTVDSVQPKAHNSGQPRQAKSAVGLRARYKPSLAGLRDSSINVARKHRVDTEKTSDEASILRISCGLYGSENGSKPSVSTNDRASTPKVTDKENATPVKYGRPFNAPSSDNLRDLRRARSRTRTTIRTVRAATPQDGDRSPGQRMAEDFLLARRQATESPASAGTPRSDFSTRYV